ncbi:MAG: class I SAM-dependent methyltransferase [Myxococcota bacterium]
MSDATAVTPGRSPGDGDGDLTITALYTSAAWAWTGLRWAELFDTREGRAVFSVTNAVLWLAGWLSAGAPSLRHSLAQRHRMIDHLVRSAGGARFVELAAGLSRRGAAFTDDPAVSYVEVDLPGVIARKEALLARTEPGREVARRPGLRRIAADVREVDLDAFAGGSPPTCVIAEGLLMYLDAAAQRTLWARIAAAVAPGGTLVFDLVPGPEEPGPSAIGRLLGALMARFTGGRGFVRDDRGRDAIRAEVLAAGFGAVDLFEPRDLAEAAQLPHLDRPTRVVVFRCRR